MASEKRTILRTVRVNPTLDKWLQEIADSENRTISNTIYNLLSQSVELYLVRKKNKEKYTKADIDFLNPHDDSDFEDNED